MKEIYMYRSQIIALTVCSRLLLLNATEIAIQNLNSIGLRCSLPETEEETEEISKKIIGKIKERSIRLKTAQKNFDAIKSNGKPISIKPSDFIDQLVVLSKWVGFRLTTEITLYEYASYMKRMNEYAESLKMKSLKNG